MFFCLYDWQNKKQDILFFSPTYFMKSSILKSKLTLIILNDFDNFQTIEKKHLLFIFSMFLRRLRLPKFTFNSSKVLDYHMLHLS